MKIPSHCFNSLYVFDYIKCDLDSAFKENKLQKKFGPWPIVSPLSVSYGDKAGEDDPSEFKDEDDARKHLYSEEQIYDEEGEEKEFCKNYLVIPQKDIVKYRALFNNMLKGVKFEHLFKYNSTGSSQKTIEKTCCERVYGLSATSEYDASGPNSYHCCDNALWDLYFGSKKAGQIDLNNESDCGSRSSGPFTLSASEAASLKVGRVLYLTFDPATSDGAVHGGVNILEVEKIGGPSESIAFGPGGGEGEDQGEDFISTSSDIAIEICYENKDANGREAFPEEACCCPPVKVKINAEDPKQNREETVTNYECSRNHSCQVEGSIEFNSSELFELEDLEGRISALQIKRAIRNDKKSDDSENSKHDTLASIGGEELYEKDWEFSSENLKRDLQQNASFLPGFPNDVTNSNDPIIAPFYNCNKNLAEYQIEVVNADFNFSDPNSFESKSDLTSEKNFGKFSLAGTFKRMSLPVENSNTDSESVDTSLFNKYNLNFEIKRPIFIKEKEEYLFFIDVYSELDVSLDKISWNAGDFYKKDFNSDEYKKYDYYSLEEKSFDNQLFKKIRIASLIDSMEPLDPEEIDERFIERNGDLETQEISFAFGEENNAEEKKFEVFKYEKAGKSSFNLEKPYPPISTKEEYKRYESDPALGIEPRAINCLKGEVNISWEFEKNLKIEAVAWGKDDFDSAAIYPPKL
jgi:hypothetical protein